MKRNHKLVAGIVAGVALTIAATTFAQPHPGMGHGCGSEMGMGTGHASQTGGDPAVMVESHLAAVKAQLNITPAQEAAWQAYSAQAQQSVASMYASHNQPSAVAQTAPEQMAQHSAAMQQHAAEVAAMTTAFSALYAVLTPEQQYIADQNLAKMGHHGPHSDQCSS